MSSLLRPEFLFIFVWAIRLTSCLPNKWAGPNHRTNEKWAVGRAGRAGRGGSSGARAYLQAVGAARATGGEESFEPGSLAALRLDGVRAREGGRQGGVFGSVSGRSTRLPARRRRVEQRARRDDDGLSAPRRRSRRRHRPIEHAPRGGGVIARTIATRRPRVGRAGGPKCTVGFGHGPTRLSAEQ